MQNNIDRAKQFLPFDALKGFSEALLEVGRKVEGKKILSEDSSEVINHKLCRLKEGAYVMIKHYYGIEYIETFGIVKKIDRVYKNIILLHTIINFDDIIDIEFITK